MIIFLLYFFRRSRLYIAKEPYNSTKQYKLTLSDLFLMETLFFAHDLPRKKPSPALLDARAVFFPHFLFRVAKRMNWLAFDPKPVFVLRARAKKYFFLAVLLSTPPDVGDQITFIFLRDNFCIFLSRKKLLKIIGCGWLGSQEEEKPVFLRKVEIVHRPY